MPPSKAAEIIFEGIEKGKTRILVGNDAKIAELWVRLFPATYMENFRFLVKNGKIIFFVMFCFLILLISLLFSRFIN